MGAMSQTMSDLIRTFDNVICLGTIAAVDHAAAKVKLSLSGRETDWLPYPAEIGANFIRWRPLRAGTQVLAACPSGNPANAVIVQILYTAALPPPSTDGSVDLIQWDDGTLVRYDSAAKKMDVVSVGDVAVQATGDITAQAAGAVEITGGPLVRIAAGNVQIVASQGGSGAAEMTGSFRLTGDFEITGNVTVNGDVTASGSIMDGAGNSNHHTH